MTTNMTLFYFFVFSIRAINCKRESVQALHQTHSNVTYNKKKNYDGFQNVKNQNEKHKSSSSVQLTIFEMRANSSERVRA